MLSLSLSLYLPSPVTLALPSPPLPPLPLSLLDINLKISTPTRLQYHTKFPVCVIRTGNQRLTLKCIIFAFYIVSRINYLNKDQSFLLSNARKDNISLVSLQLDIGFFYLPLYFLVNVDCTARPDRLRWVGWTISMFGFY